MKKIFPFQPEAVALPIQIMYRTCGIYNTLIYIKDIIAPLIPVHRINMILVYREASTVVNLADTSSVAVSNKHSSGESTRPLVLSDRLDSPIIVCDLSPYQKDPYVLNEPLWKDMPYLHFSSLLRIPLFANRDNTFLINFWSSNKDSFDMDDAAFLQELLAPLTEELREKFTDIEIRKKSSSSHPLLGVEKLALCPGLMKTKHLVESVAKSNSTVLILGETGVGKESIVDALYQLSSRNGKPLVKVNCGAIPRELIDSELFGHEKGSFTGALTSRPGYFEMADGGILFLDEIGEMSLESQVRLLRVLDSGMVRRIGGGREVQTDVRIVAATHEDLLEKVKDGRFRLDLWYRIAVFPIRVPPLRERISDIPVLVKYFAESKAHQLGLETIHDIPEEEILKLLHHSWPGNVRELEHVVERALIKYSSGIDNGKITFDIVSTASHPPYTLEGTDRGTVLMLREPGEWPTLKEMESRYIREVVQHCKGKMTGENSATKILGIHYTTLRTRLEG